MPGPLYRGRAWVENLLSKGVPEVNSDSVKTEANATKSRQPEAVAYQTESGTVAVVGDDDEGVIANDSDLSAAVSAAWNTVDSIAVAKGTYGYTTDLYLPSRCSIHFDRVVLNPDGCKGLVTGDGTTLHDKQHITGSFDMLPDNGNTTATHGVKIYGSKLLELSGNFNIRSGFVQSAFEIDGGDEGAWWNYYEGVYNQGRTLIHTTGVSPANAHVFNGSLFRGQFDFEGGNALVVTDSWMETINNGNTVEISGSNMLLDVRIENVDININNALGHDLTFRRNYPNISKNYVEEDPDSGNSISIQKPDNQYKKEFDGDGVTVEELVQLGAFNSDSEAVHMVKSLYESSGQSNGYRATTFRPGGYAFGAFSAAGNRAAWIPSSGYSGFAASPRPDPSGDDLPSDNQAMIFVSDGSETGAVGDLCYAVNDAGTIKTAVIQQSSNAT